MRTFICIFFVVFGHFLSAEEKDPLNVLIIGGGPAGLATAIEAKLSGCSVTIVEKREKYSRFQIIALWDEALALLEKWEISMPELRVYDLPKGSKEGCQVGIITIKWMEEALAKKVREWEIKEIQGVFQSFGSEKTALIETSDHEELQISYDVIIAADGARSLVRDSLSIKKDCLGFALGAWMIIPNFMNDSEITLPPIIKQDNAFFRIINIPLLGKMILTQAPLDGSKNLIKKFFESQGMTKEFRLVNKGLVEVFENIPVSLDQAQTFINKEKSAILVGDSAATASPFRGKGLNAALKESEIAGDFFKELHLNRETAFQKFNQSMKETTDALIEDSAFLFKDLPWD